MDISDEKVCVILFDHFSFIPLSEHSFPSIAVFTAPIAIRLRHFPIGAHDAMAATGRLGASELISKLHRYLFQRGPRSGQTRATAASKDFLPAASNEGA